MNLKTKLIALSGFLIPAVAFAQNTSYIQFWIDRAVSWLGTAVTVIMVIMTLYFLYSVLQFIMSKADKPEDVAGKKRKMINGLIGLFIAVAVWGIIRLAASVFGVQTTETGGQIQTVTCPPGFNYSSLTHTCQ